MVKIDSGQRPSLRDCNEKWEMFQVIKKWQKVAWHLPENHQWIIEIYDEVLDGKYYEEFGFDSVDKFMREKVLFNYDQFKKDSRDILDIILKTTPKVNETPGAPEGNDNASKDRNKVGNTHIVYSGSNEPSYKIARLKRDRPELAEKVISGELTPNAAFIEAGFANKKMTVPLIKEKVVGWILKYFNEDDIEYIKNNL